MRENANAKPKNILLTTISTMNNPGINCYRVDIKGRPYLCTGISQQEPGSKYFFKNNRIDRVVAICSDEVMGNGEDIHNESVTDDFRVEWDKLKEKWEENKDVYAFTAVDFYKLRLGAFLYDTEFDERMLKDFIASLYHKESFEDVENIEKEGNIGDFEYDEEKANKMIDCLTEQKLVEDKEVVKYINGYLSPVRWNYDDDYTSKLYEEFCKGKVDDNEALIQYAGSFDKNYGRSYLWFKVYQMAGENDRTLKAKAQKEDSPLEFAAVKDQYANGVANINGIIEAIKKDCGDEGINVFIDVQGGSRTSQFTVYNVMQILSDEAKYQEASHNEMLHVCATYYNPRKLWMNEIVDETKRYNIINAVSGMNAFIRFGRTKALQTYFSDTKDRDITKLKDQLKSFEDSLLRNRTEDLQKSLVEIYENITGSMTKTGEANKDGNVLESLPGEKQEPLSEIEEMYNILKEQIYRSLEGLVEDGRIDYMRLVDWCFDHNHILQAYTIAESKMPEYIIKNNILHIDESIDYLKVFYIFSYAKALKLELSVSGDGTLNMIKNVDRAVHNDYKDPYHYIIADYLNSNSEDSRKHLNIYLKSDEGSLDDIADFISKFEKLARTRNGLAHSSDAGSSNTNQEWYELKSACEKYRCNDDSDTPNPLLDRLSINSYFHHKNGKKYIVNDEAKEAFYRGLLEVIKRDIQYGHKKEWDRIYYLNKELCIVISKYNVVGIVEGILDSNDSKKYGNKLLILLWNAVFAGKADGFIQHVKSKYTADEPVWEDIPQIEIPAVSEESRDETKEQLYTVEEEPQTEENEEVDGTKETEDTGREHGSEEGYKTEEAEDTYKEQNVDEKAGSVEDDNKEEYEYLKNEIVQLNARVKELEWQVNNLEKQTRVDNTEHKGFFKNFFLKNH